MKREEVVAMVKDALKMVKEAQDLLVQIQLWAMDRELFWYASVAENAGDNLYWGQKEIEELLGLECEELE